MKRHSNLSLQKGDSTSQTRMNAMDNRYNSAPDASKSSQVVSDNRLCYPIIGSPEEHRSPVSIGGHSSSDSWNTTNHTNSETNATGGTPT